MRDAVPGPVPIKVDRPSLALRVIGCAGLVAFAGSFLFIAAYRLPVNAAPRTALFNECFFAAFALGALAAGWSLLRSAVILWSDRIERINGFSTRSLTKSDIVGLRIGPRAGNVRLMPRDVGLRPLIISNKFLSDPRSSAWFEGIPDLTAQDAEAFANDERLGATPEERQRRLAQLIMISRVAVGAGFGLAIWVLFWPRPHDVAVLCAVAAIPVALALKLGSGFLLDVLGDQTDDPRPAISVLIMLPAIAVFIRSMQDFNLLDWKPALQWSLCMTAVLTVPLLINEPSLRKKPYLGLYGVMFLSLYSFGSIAGMNEVLDSSRAHSYRTTIVDMHIQSGKSQSYHLVLGGWNGRPEGDDVRVSYAFYRERQIGELICVYLRDGWLGFRYYNVGECGR
jgi:hypothetical protein